MKVIYIAGKYRDERGEYYVRCNIREAEHAAIFVWKSGGVALCPHKNTAGFGGVASDDIWMLGDLELLSRCDALWAIDNHIASEGALREIECAKIWKIPVLYTQSDVLKFLGVI